MPTEEAAHDILEDCIDRGWHALVGIEPDMPPDLSDYEWLLRRYERAAALEVPRGPSQNAPCPCGSGRKYKRCCGRT